MRFFNKLDGLNLLTRALAGSKVSRVLQWRVYRSPNGIQNSHFTNPRHGYVDAANVTHLLVRTDGLENLTEEQWQGYPRVKHALSGDGQFPSLIAMKQYMQEKSAPFKENLRYIVHGVRPTGEYVLQGKVSFDGEKISLKIGFRTNEHTWRHNQSGSEASNSRAIEVGLKALDWNGEPRFDDGQKAAFREKFVANLSAALKQIKAEARKTGAHEFEASFAVPALEFEQHAEPIVEWYDFLHLPKGKVAEWQVRESRREPHHLAV